MHMNENTVIDIQTALAHQEQQIADLNTVINDQWTEIDRLKSKLDKILRKLETVDDSENIEASTPQSLIDQARNNIPPHY